MNKKRTSSFDEMMKGRYGAPGDELERRAPDTASVGKRYGVATQSAPNGNGRLDATASIMVSLSCDDGETLRQRRNGASRSQYVVQRSTDSATFEEYVVTGAASAQPRKTLEREPAAGEIAVNEEYLVDVREPLAAPAPTVLSKSASRLPIETPRAPRRELVQARPAVERRPPPPVIEDTSHAQATEDDFVADMQQILSGQKVFDPLSKKTVAKEQLGQPPADPQRSDSAGRLPHEGKNGQAIFDRIAESMQYANAYDFGTVELGNRFAQFDRIADQEQVAAEKKKTNGRAGAKASSMAASGADFVQDLDAIRQRAARPEARLPPRRFSRPFYDTGEHVLTGEDLYPDLLRVGPDPGVRFSYGQIIAMGDMYDSVDDMMAAPLAELTKLKTLIERSTSSYKEKKSDASLNVSDTDWESATNERFLKLAENNYEHFSPAFLVGGSGSKAVTKHGNNKSAWEYYHQRAMEEARKMFAAEKEANSTLFMEWPLIINAFGDHLTDAFAAGHLINKDAMIEEFKSKFFSGGALTADGQAFFAKVAELAFVGDVRQKFSVLETADYPVCKWGWCFKWHPNIDSTEMFRKLLVEAANQEPERIANFAVKALHDRLNEDGVEVYNDAGDGTWTLSGDGTLDEKNLPIIKKAVQQSVDDVNDPSILSSNTNFGHYFDGVWKHTPKLSPASQKKVATLAADYTRPGSTVLREAAAAIIRKQVDSLIKLLVKEGKLKPA